MEHSISRSEKKRQVKSLDDLARELVELSSTDIKKLPCDDFLKQEIASVRAMKSGARKRQMKFITKNLRQCDPDGLFEFLAQKKGSKLQATKEFHDIERLRDAIIEEAINGFLDAASRNSEYGPHWHNSMVDFAAQKFPKIDAKELRGAAVKFAVCRKPLFKREIFRLLKAEQEREKFVSPPESDGEEEN